VSAIARSTALGLDAVFDSEYEGLTRALTVLSSDRDLAAEAVMEAFARAWQRWGRIVSYDDQRAWIRRVALNRVATEQRNSRRRQATVARWAEQAVPASCPPRDHELLRAVRGLPRRQQEAVVLYYLANLSYRTVDSGR
jgi:RNA polymerase sigma-70 factor (ECF subfamily)